MAETASLLYSRDPWTQNVQSPTNCHLSQLIITWQSLVYTYNLSLN